MIKASTQIAWRALFDFIILKHSYEKFEWGIKLVHLNSKLSRDSIEIYLKI